MINDYDKINGDIAFYEDAHKYINVRFPQFNYTSITTLIGKYYEKFDEEFFSRYKALESLISVDDFARVKGSLLATKKWDDELLIRFNIDPEFFESVRQALVEQWKATNKEACDIGTATHLEKENEWYEKTGQLLRKRIPSLEGDFDCIKHDFSLARDKAVIPEYLVYYSCPENILHLAGQVDLLVKDGNDLYILDYKTNKKGIQTKAFYDTKRKSTKKMFYPINNLDDTTMIHYNLQLSIYAWMLKQMNPDFNIKLLRLIHIDREGVETEYDIPFLEEDVTRLLAYHKRQIKTQIFRNKYSDPNGY